MNKLAFLTAILLSTAAFADTNQNVGTGNVINDVSGAGNIVNSNNGTNVSGGITAKAYGGNAEQRQSQHQGQFQGQSSYNNNSNKGNTQSVSFKDRLQAPAVFAPGLANGFECNGSTTIGGSVAGFGVGGGSTHANEDCVNVYLAGVLLKMKDEEGAWGILCESPKIAKHAKNCLKPSAKASSNNSETVVKSEYPTGRSARYNY